MVGSHDLCFTRSALRHENHKPCLCSSPSSLSHHRRPPQRHASPARLPSPPPPHRPRPGCCPLRFALSHKPQPPYKRYIRNSKYSSKYHPRLCTKQLCPLALLQLSRVRVAYRAPVCRSHDNPHPLERPSAP
ncbi:hypothetical protein K439DRAFT_1039669 [Ramaria rubella]|nr:hypothetical protein K439DRAFT_1039669 [Ramaria rubella]